MATDLQTIQSQTNDAEDNSGNIYEFENFRLDSSLLMLYESGQTVSLAPKVVETLLALIERRGEIVSKQEMMNRLWAGSFVEDSNLTQNIYLLRKTLGKGADGRDLIETFRRRGYRFTGKIKESNSSLKPKLEKSDLVDGSPSVVLDTQKKSLLSSRYLIVSGIALLLIFGLVFLYWLKTKKSIANAVPTNISLKRLTPDLKTSNPAISTNGEIIAYASLAENGENSLWLRDMRTGETKQLLSAAVKSYLGLQFSPNGKELYYLLLVNKEGASNHILAGIDIESGVKREVVGSVSVWFALSPDGRQVAFVRDTDLIVAETDGSGTERIISKRDGKSKWFSSQNAQPAWSADSQRIYISSGYLEQNIKHSELIEVNVNDGTEKRLQSPVWDKIGSVAWAHDGKGLYVIAREEPSQPTQIFYLSLNEGTTEKITKDLHNYNSLSVTADSRLIVTEQIAGKSDIWLAEKDDLTKIKQITFDEEENTAISGIAFMPDGRIVFTSPRNGNLDLWIMNPDGSNQKQLTSNMGNSNIRPRPTSNGRYIVFQSYNNSQNNIWRIDADGKNAIQLTNENEDNSSPDVSPDGQWVYYIALTNNHPVIWKISINGGTPTQVLGAETGVSPAISPDGKLAAFGTKWDAIGSTEFSIVSLETGKQIKTLEIGAFRRIIRWTPDSKSLIYIQRNSPNLWEQPIDGSQPRQITNFNLEQTWNFAFSPDYQKIAIVRGSINTESVLINIR